jgi:hypothetical protein
VERLQKPDSSRASDLPARSGDADAAAALESGDSGLKEAEARGRQQPIGDAQLPASLLRTAPTANVAQELAAERYCDESETADPNAWLECILELERQGLFEAARLERELLAEAFPPPELP